MRVALIGDIHGCIDELIELHQKILAEGVDDIWALGDLVDRGPEPGEVIDYLQQNHIYSIKGNHEQSICGLWPGYVKQRHTKLSPDKSHTLSKMTEEKIKWMNELPKLHCIDELNLVLAHGGLYPVPIYAQPDNVIRAQMIHPREFGKSKWWGHGAFERYGQTEDQMRGEGWKRWYEVYNRPENVAFGHSVFPKPFQFKTEVGSNILGIDTGSCFGGTLTAAIISENWVDRFISVKARMLYSGLKLVQED